MLQNKEAKYFSIRQNIRYEKMHNWAFQTEAKKRTINIHIWILSNYYQYKTEFWFVERHEGMLILTFIIISIELNSNHRGYAQISRRKE